VADKFVITEEDIDRELDLLVENPNHGKRLSFIITEGDIDHELDLLLESLVSTYRSEITAITMGKSLARDPLHPSGQPNKAPRKPNPAFADAPTSKERNRNEFTEEQSRSVCAELTKFKEFVYRRGPDSEATAKFSQSRVDKLILFIDERIDRFGFCEVKEDPCTGGRVKNDEGECRCPPGYHWVPAKGAPEATTDEPDRRPYRTLEEVDAVPTGEGEVIPPNAEGECVKDEKVQAPELSKVQADIETTDMSLSGTDSARMVGGWRSVGDAKTTQLKKQFGPAAFGLVVLNMYDFLIKTSANAVIQFRVSDDSFDAGAANTIMAKWKNVLGKQVKEIHTIVAKAKEDEEEMQKIADSIKDKNEKLLDLKTQLEKDPVRTKAFNALREALWGVMIKEYFKEYEKIKGPEEEESTLEEKQEGVDKMRKLNEDKLTEIVIDFNEIRSNQLDESFLAMFGGWVEYLLKRMFGGSSMALPVSVTGNQREVESFASALGQEKKFIDVAKRYGLDHPSTYKSKAKLDNATKNFERETGIKWPFK